MEEPMPEESTKPEEKAAKLLQDLPATIRSRGQPEPSAARDRKGLGYDRYLVSIDQKLDQARKDLAELRTEVDELRGKSSPRAAALDPEGEAKKHHESPSSPPQKEWDEYAMAPTSLPDRQKAHTPHPLPRASSHPSQKSADRSTPAQARHALHHLHEASREIGGQAPPEEKRLEKEFDRLQHQREQFFDQTARVVRDAANRQQDQRLRPERVAKDEDRLRRDWALLREKREIVQGGSHSLEQDAARFGKEHPNLRKEAERVVREAHREGRDLPPILSEPLSRHRPPPPSHAQKAMEALREKAKETDSPTCAIVTQAGRHLHIFESSRKELLALHKKCGEDLVRLQKDQALHPEEWKRLRDDRRRLARDQASIHGGEQILGQESLTIGRLAREIGNEDPFLKKTARQLGDQVRAENRDAHRFLPAARPGDHRSGGRDR